LIISSLHVEDVSFVLSNPDTTSEQRKQARNLKQQLPPDLIEEQGGSIKSMFMTHEQLMQCNLQVGMGAAPSLRLARSFMDKKGPVCLGDGTPKHINALPKEAQEILDSGLRPSDEDMCTALNAWGIGHDQGGLGTYFGEVAFWQKWKGELLGKQKWEAHAQTPARDIATLQEL
jgi:hypothetical protein